jgi:predicted DNA-binding transcriptional regulator AlpA
MTQNKIQTVSHEDKPVRGKLVGIKEASERIFMKKTWIYERMRNGTLPFPWFCLASGKRAFDTADLDDYLRARKVPAGTALKGGAMKR